MIDAGLMEIRQGRAKLISETDVRLLCCRILDLLVSKEAKNKSTPMILCLKLRRLAIRALPIVWTSVPSQPHREQPGCYLLFPLNGEQCCSLIIRFYLKQYFIVHN